MAIIATFQNVDASNFNINGRNAPKIFNCIKLSDTRLSIVNVFDNSQELFRNIAFDEIEVDGVVYGNLEDLVTAINPVIYAPASVQNVSQAQLNAIQAIIDDLPNLYADINHLHEGVYLTEQEIINLIALNPQASDIASAEIVGVQLRFLDAQDNVLFSLNASPFFRQGNLLQYNDVTGKLSLRNQFFNLLSEVTIEPKSFDFDKAEFVTGIANDLSNLNLERDFYIVETLDESIYFVSAFQALTFSNPWRFKVLKNDFEQDLQNPDISNANLKAYELTAFDLADIEDNEELKFDFWRITEPSGGGGTNQNLEDVLTVGNDTSLPIVFRAGEFSLNVDGVDLVSDGRTLSLGFNDSAQILTLSSDLTENREQTLQDKDGTIALLDDVDSKRKQVFVIDDGSSLTLDGSRDAVVINDSNSIINVDIPLPTNDNKGREFTFTAVENRITLNISFTQVDGFVSDTIFEGDSFTIISTGTRYQLIQAIM